jgi:agmatine/peptidylarginine deiminase
MRKLIEEMVEKDGHVIESNEKGYSMITSQEQFIAAKKYLNKKSMALLMREYNLNRNWLRKTAPLIVNQQNQLTS